MQASNSVALNTCVGSYGNEINPAVVHDSSAKVNSSASDHDMEEKSSDDKVTFRIQPFAYSFTH